MVGGTHTSPINLPESEVRKGIVICRRRGFRENNQRKEKEGGFSNYQRSQTINPMTMATTSNAPSTYLLAANHDSEEAAEPENKAESSRPGASAETFCGRLCGKSSTKGAEIASSPATRSAVGSEA